MCRVVAPAPKTHVVILHFVRPLPSLRDPLYILLLCYSASLSRFCFCFCFAPLVRPVPRLSLSVYTLFDLSGVYGFLFRLPGVLRASCLSSSPWFGFVCLLQLSCAIIASSIQLCDHVRLVVSETGQMDAGSRCHCHCRRIAIIWKIQYTSLSYTQEQSSKDQTPPLALTRTSSHRAHSVYLYPLHSSPFSRFASATLANRPFRRARSSRSSTPSFSSPSTPSMTSSRSPRSRRAFSRRRKV